jgi:pimeloyl-ACP methyl ester carboxylesterase
LGHRFYRDQKRLTALTEHYFEHPLVYLHYYKFGSGSQPMLCFHGFGMHGKQFKGLEPRLGEKYTFYGFDLFFHKETKLKDNSLATAKRGLPKKDLAALVTDFCKHEQIDRFSIIGYSMGSHYATVIAEELPERVDEYIVAAPSCIKPGMLITFFSEHYTGNKIMEKLALSETALFKLLALLRKLSVIDDEGRNILIREVETAELRFNFYACFTYLRYFKTNPKRIFDALNNYPIRSIFIFGKRDKMFPPSIGNSFFAKFKKGQVIVLDKGHDMIDQNFADTLAGLLL